MIDLPAAPHGLTQPRGTGFALPSAVPAPSVAGAAIRQAVIAATPGATSVGTPRRVVDQGPVNCCVSCALASAMEVLHPGWPALAPLFHYFVARFEDRGADASGFLRLHDALVTLLRSGICEEVQHVRLFTEADAARGPSPAARRDASQRRPRLPRFFAPLSGPSWSTAIRDQLKIGRPVVAGIRLPVGYPTGFLDSRHEWTDPTAPALSQTGHCVLVTGFDDTRVALRIHDSQGARFDAGQWWMSYRVADGGAVVEACGILTQA